MVLSVIQRGRNTVLSGRKKCFRKRIVAEGRNLQNVYSSIFIFNCTGVCDRTALHGIKWEVRRLNMSSKPTDHIRTWRIKLAF
jgi:hypothetical protein